MRCGCNCGSATNGVGCAGADAGNGGNHCYRPQNGCPR